jgi:hypothetical protein
VNAARRRERARDAVWIVALTIGTWLVWHFLIVRRPVQIGFDTVDLFVYFVHAYAYEATRLRELAVPLWNPFQAGGVPFLATLQPGALYPARLLLLVTGVTRAMAWATVAHLALLVVATYVACRALGARRSGAVVGAGVFAVACARPMLFSPSFLESSTWIPIMTLAAHRTIVTGRWRWVALLGVAAAMPILAGGYQVAVYAAYGLVVFVGALLCDPRRRGDRPVVGVLAQLALAGVLAIGLASPQMLPTLAWSGESVRQTSQLTDAQIHPLAFTPWQYVLAGKIVQLTIPGTILAVIGLMTAGRFGLVLGAFSLAGLFLSLGPGAPGFWVYRHLPAFGMFRGPGRIFTTQVAFFGAVAASLGFSALVRLGPLERSRLRPAVEALALGLVLLALVPRMKNDAVLPWTSWNRAFLDGMPGMLATLAESEGRVAMFGRPGDWAVTPRHGMSHGFRVLTDYEPLSSRHLRDYLRALTGLPDEGVPFTGAVVPRARLPRPALFDLAAVDTLVLPKESPAKEHAPPLVETGDFVLYDVFRNPSALPRAYLTDHVRVVPAAAAALATITDPSFDGHREAVVVGAPDEVDTATLRSAPPTPVRPARLVVDAPEHVAIEFSTDRPALLVLADAHAPGWEVRIDGIRRPVRRVNHLVRGVVVLPGERRADFTYRAPGLAAGVTTAMLSVGIVALCAALARRRPRRRSGTDRETRMPAPEHRCHGRRREEVADEHLTPRESTQHRLREDHADEDEAELEHHEQEDDAEAEVRVALGEGEEARAGHSDQEKGEHVHPCEAQHHLEVDGPRRG